MAHWPFWVVTTNYDMDWLSQGFGIQGIHQPAFKGNADKLKRAMKVPLPHPRIVRSFVEQMSLNSLDNVTFESTRGALPWGGEGLVDGEAHLRAYGDHVFDCRARLSHTFKLSLLSVDVTRLLTDRTKSVSGNWVFGGLPDEPFQYKVRTIKGGKRFCVRMVEVRQAGSVDPDDICFSCICSFKKQDCESLSP